MARGGFKKSAYFHLYNLSLKGDIKLQPPYEGWLFTELEPRGVATLFGESSAHSFISPATTGTHFLVCQDTDGFEKEDLYGWLSRRWKDAQPYRQILQYAVDGIVNIDYACPYFSPTWVNEVHKWGLYYLGEPRREGLPYPFHRVLFEADQGRINRMWRTYIRHRERINSSGGTLRKAIRIAGQFFEDYHRKTSRVEQFTSLIIALEALFSPTRDGEATFRICQSCALLAVEYDHSDKRQEVYEFLKKMFKRRGKLFHGQFDVAESTPDELATDEEIHELASLVRLSILRLLAIHLRGENDLEGLRGSLQRAALDERLRDDLFRKGDFEELIDDSQISLLPSMETVRQTEASNLIVEHPSTPAS